jgi:hypothetical protein
MNYVITNLSSHDHPDHFHNQQLFLYHYHKSKIYHLCDSVGMIATILSFKQTKLVKRYRNISYNIHVKLSIA